MKSTLRRTLALTLGSLALAVGLGVPSAAPASAASCTEVTGVGGTIAHIANVTDQYGQKYQQIAFDGVYAKTSSTGCGASSSYRYLALVSYSGGTVGGEVSLTNRGAVYTNTVSFPSRSTYFWVPQGYGTITLDIEAQTKDYFGNWQTRTTASWRVNVPNTGFNSATGEGMGPDSCTYDPTKQYIVSKWC
jgi:hypothetical protein